MDRVEDVAKLEDAELARRGHAGDQKALEELMKRYERGLYLFIRRFVGSAADPDDVYQEVVLRAIANLGRFNPQLSFRTWIYTLAANYCKNVLRSREQRGKYRSSPTKRARDDSEIDVLETSPDTAPGPDKAAEASQFMAALGRELSNLPPAQREVFVLREFNNVPFKEIASILKIPEATARSRMFLALEYLRVRLREFAAEEGRREAKHA